MTRSTTPSAQRQVATIFGELDQHHVILELDLRYQEDVASLEAARLSYLLMRLAPTW
jgi:hypothetical protein